MSKEKEKLEKITSCVEHTNEQIAQLLIKIKETNEIIKKLGEQLNEVKKNQQPIIINSSPVWPTNDPMQPTEPNRWWQYTPTITSTTTETIKMGDAK